MLMVLAFFVDKMPWNTRLMLTQWVVYIIFLCLFHMAEFFVTAIWTPSALTASSFLVNHSLAYTTAFIVSAFSQFGSKFRCFSFLFQV